MARSKSMTARNSSIKASLTGVMGLAATLLLSAAPGALAEEKTAILSGGCFWCIESDFEKVPGVTDVVSGYIGGQGKATYKTHSKNGYLEAVRITYDSTKVSYNQLLDIFWRTVDPIDAGGQFCDRGNSYTTAIFALNEEQANAAAASKAAIDESGVLPKKIATPIRMAPEFFEAEGYHQDYYKKNPIRYKFYRTSCGRDKRVKELWGDMAYSGVPHS